MTPNKNRYVQSFAQLSDEEKAALARLDETSSDIVNASCVMNIVGVMAGIKPATYIEVRDGYAPLLEQLGLICVSTQHEGIAVSYDAQLATQLAMDIQTTWGKKQLDRAAETRIGKALGYPESAIEHFIVRFAAAPGEELPMVEVPDTIPDMPHENFVQFILSPGHYPDEIRAYAKPLEEATHIYAPRSYEIIIED